MNINLLQLFSFAPLFFIVLAGFVYFILGYYLVVGFSNSKLNMVLWGTVGVRLIYPLLLAVGQYYVFVSNAFTKTLLNSPLDENVPLPFYLYPFSQILKGHLGYFLYYAWGRFFLAAVLAFICALVFYGFLKVLEKYNPRFFKEGEVKVGFIVSLLIGWPWFVVLIPATFVVTIFVSVFKKIFFKEPYTTLGMPMLIAGVILTVAIYFFSPLLLGALDLSVLKI